MLHSMCWGERFACQFFINSLPRTPSWQAF